MADEDCQERNEFELLNHIIKRINIKLVKCGGLTPALEMIAKAKVMISKS
jgi:L-alanine-DL-glutamate epimerase-like enolase superfamily enzyme